MARSLDLLSPAKLNLFLHITGRRKDGYHMLQTVFQLLDYSDRMHFSLLSSPEIRLRVDDPSLEGQDNLAVKAARKLQQAAGTGQGAEIRLEKRIPLGGGLGGGSSNAATTLLALNRLWGLRLSDDRLAEIGLSLGADVPVFVHGRSAWAEGVGENLTPMCLPQRWYVVLTPGCRVSTAEIFSHGQLTRNTSPIKIPAFPILGGKNDCEAVAARLYPAIDRALDWLGRYGQARMTGTGSSVFADFASHEEAESVLREKPGHLAGFVAKGINVSPARLALEETDDHWGVAKW